ncbi:hypothetical protein [Sphingomonas flavescens]|uniref:hypothetical protein n=1 Tax=Sphingomonas flavescens TaxID=3132797 RepID=UPI0028038EDD|nr:hypothetical protein [Sphingomonas limnosediminicola]
MAKLHDDWEVLPHGPLREVAPGLMTVVGQIPMPLGNFPRRMTVVALPRKRTAIFSPIPLPDAEMARIQALGTPSFIIVPNGGHRLDSRPFKARYPKAKVVAAPGAKAQVDEAVRVDTSTPDLGKDVDLVSVPGMGDAELALVVRHDGGTTLVVNDIVGNVSQPQGIGARIMARLTGFGPRPAVPRLLRMRYVKDEAALAAQLRDWSEIPGLIRLIPSHGEIIDRPAATLRRLADNLA